MRYLSRCISTLSIAGLLWCASTSFAGTNLITTSVQGSGANWTAAIWKTNNGADVGIGTAVAPVAGNTYTLVYNGVGVGNNLNETRVRNPVVTGQPAVVSFPGDSLTLNTNTEIRFKQIAAGNVPISDFPGVGGNPGLILNGGMLNCGDDAIFTVTGKIQVKSYSMICPGNNDGANAVAARSIIISGQLSGSGNLLLWEAFTNNALVISGTSNTYSGQWIIKAGLLRGTVTNSLGTNSITMDPFYVVPVTNAITDVPGPAVLEPMYDLNSAGVLYLTNGGTMKLHQNVEFSGVVIEGVALANRTYFYSELITNYPNSFLPGGSGSITVQPYGPPPPLAPIILAQPYSETIYPGQTAHFGVQAQGFGIFSALTYQWQRSGTNLVDGGNISGANTPFLTVSGVSAADVTAYDVVVSNGAGPTPSAIVNLSLGTPLGLAYETAVLANSPAAYYNLNDMGDPNANAPAVDFVGGYNGTLGFVVQNGNPLFGGVAGPRTADSFPGFGTANAAMHFFGSQGASKITLPAFNFATNALSIVAWVNPTFSPLPSSAILFCRSSNTVAGLIYTSYVDPNTGYQTLGYNWNNEAGTYTWNSGLITPPGQWSLVALAVGPSNATIYVFNTNSSTPNVLVSSTHIYAHTNQNFGGPSLIGDDSFDNGNGARAYEGLLDEIAIFKQTLSQEQLVGLYTAASGGSTNFPPTIALQPAGFTTLYQGQPLNLNVVAGGNPAVTYQWKAGAQFGGVYTNLNDGAHFSGTHTANLVISNSVVADTADYVVVISNPNGTVTSAIANVTVQPPGAPTVITMTPQQAAGADWETGADWSDGLPASVSVFANPHSTYEILPGARLRSPQGLPAITNFPGDVLQLDGDAIWNVNPPALGATISEIRFKQPANGVINFPRLVMNGGQLDCGNDGIVTVGGRIDILTNAPINNDAGSDRGYVINAWLTGNTNASIEIHGYNQTAFQPSYTNSVGISGTSNTYQGAWNIVTGKLLALATNCLGTNDITVGTLGAFETMYNITNARGNLFLNGRMHLHQDCTFQSMFITNSIIPAGTYTFAQLNAAYPAFFPATWTSATGSGISNGSGSITILGAQGSPIVLVQPASSTTMYAQQNVQFTVTADGAPTLGFQWKAGAQGSGVYTNVLNGGNISGATTTNLVINNLAVGNTADYVLFISNSFGSVFSSIASLTVLPIGPPENITMVAVQPAGNDWNTAADWSDGLPASTSSQSKPGSTYEILPGGRMRSPASAADATFPGDVLTVEGDGVLLENSTTAGEIRFKHANPGIVRFKKLILNGGQIDSGDNGVVILKGQIDVATNSGFYVDSAAGGDRPYQIDAWLTGSGGLQYNAFDASFTGGLNITGTSNTFSGTWLVTRGVLLGSGSKSLGTNSITVSSAGALETTYDINSPGASLIVDGQVFLHQNDTFNSVTVGGGALAPGTYTFAQLNTAYPTNFPATWTIVSGSTYFLGSGSITVLGGALPPPPATTINTVNVSGGSVSFKFSTVSTATYVVQYKNALTDPTWQDALTIPGTGSPAMFSETPGVATRFYRVIAHNN